MSTFPIIPIWIMAIICFIMLFFIITKTKKIIHILIVILIFIINLRIMILSGNSKIVSNNLDVLFVIDNTISMVAEDYNGNNTRLSGVKNDCKNIIKRLNGARFSVITFNNTAKIVIPYTRDSNMAIEAIDIIEPIEELYAKGSSLNTPIETIISSLKSSTKKGDKKRIIFFISDGEITDNSNIANFSEISKYIDNGAIMGYGTTKGGYMKSKDKYSETESYITEYSNSKYEKAISRINENNLKKIAKDINIDYINMENQNKINNKLKEIEKLINNTTESIEKSNYDDIYYIFVIPLLILLIIDFNQFRRKNI